MKYRFLFAFALWAQAALAQLPVIREHIDKDLPFPIFVNTVFQDSHGWIWCGTRQGLFRYDGLHFYTVLLPSEKNNVSAITEYNHHLWIGFMDGSIGLLPVSKSSSGAILAEKDNAHQSVLTIWNPEEGLPRHKITGFVKDQSNFLWFSTYGEGLYVWTGSRMFQFSMDDGLISDDIYAITLDAHGKIWAATDGGVSICQLGADYKKDVQNISKTDGLTDEIVTSVYTGQDGNIIIGTQEKGLCECDIATKKCTNLTPNWIYGSVNTITQFDKQTVWVGTEKSGLCKVTSRNGLVIPNTFQDGELEINAFLKDREGNLWMTKGKGELVSANMRFGYHKTPFSDVQAVVSDDDGRIWAGNKDGLWLQNGNAFIPILKGNPYNIISLWYSKNTQTIWAGTFGAGIVVLNLQGKILYQINESNGLPNGSILSVSGYDHQVWVATLGGAYHIQMKNATPKIQLVEPVGNNYVYKVLVDSQKRVWFGTDGKGLFLMDKNGIKSIHEVNGIPLKTIYAITEDPSGYIWFSSDRDGLFSYKDGIYKHYHQSNSNLHSNVVTALAADANGILVIGYEDGADLLNPMRHNHLNFCSPAIGAPRISAALNAIHSSTNGQVHIGSKEGIVSFHAYQTPFVDDPQPIIADVQLFGLAIDMEAKNVLEHHENYLTFHYTGLWYQAPENVRYRYKIENYDHDWKQTKDQIVSYPNLPPGKYRFIVQTSEHGNFENVPEASWSFVIKQPFWATWWFLSLSILAISGLVWYVIRMRENRLKKAATLKRENIATQLAVIKSQINPHFLFNSFNTLITIIEENPKMAVEYVEQLSDFYRRIIVYREKDFISIGEELETVKNYEFLLQKRYETGFKIINRVLTNQENQTLIMPLTLQMLIENALKHNIISGSKPLTIEVFTDMDYIVVRNNIQRKISPEPGTQFGLDSLKNRYALITSRPVLIEDNVAFFSVKIPIIYNVNN